MSAKTQSAGEGVGRGLGVLVRSLWGWRREAGIWYGPICGGPTTGKMSCCPGDTGT